MTKKTKIEEVSLKRLRFLLLIFVGFLGLIYSFVSRHSMTSDGVSYLDMADQFLRTDFSALVNGIWSPLYPFFLSIGLYLFKPDNYNEFTVIHIVNFVLYLVALLSFDFFIFSFLNYQEKQYSEEKQSNLVSVPKWGFISIGYSLFALSSLNIMGLWGADPDICLSIFVYLTLGVLYKIALDGRSNLNFIFLGATLGFGYLAKAPMLPLSFVFLALCYFLNTRTKKIFFKLCFTVLVFVLIVAPYILGLSLYKGHFTVGESGKLNYAWYVNDVPFFVHFQGDKSTTLIHPTKKIYNDPPVYEFSEPLFGTYPPWTDPTYWYEGISVKFDLIRQLAMISASLQIYYDIFFKLLGFLLAGVSILFYIAQERKILEYKILIIPALFAFTMFSLVHLEPRYVGAFITPFFLGLISSLRFSKQFEVVVDKIVSILLLMLMLTIGMVDGKEISSWSRNGSEHIEWNVANEISKLGIKEGDKVGIIGYSIPYSPYWARVAKVKIVAEITEKDSNRFFESDIKTRQEVLNAFKASGVKIIIINKLPLGFPKEGLYPLPNKLFAYLL